jgi:hypothetical protein
MTSLLASYTAPILHQGDTLQEGSTEVLFHLARSVHAKPRAEPLADVVHFFGDSVVPQPASWEMNPCSMFI